MIYPCKGISLINKEKLSIDMGINMDKLKHHTMWKKEKNTKDDILMIIGNSRKGEVTELVSDHQEAKVKGQY